MDEVLYKRIRPTSFKDVIGQDAAISTLKQFGKRKQVPRFMLFIGGSGTGKTTIARILATKLKCSPHDLVEVNSASANGVDVVRDIEKRCRLAPMGGAVRVWIIDECHQLTKAAQNAFLKLLEDTPKHVHFFFATTDPQKLLKTVRSRATEIKLSHVTDSELTKYVQQVAKAEGMTITEDVAEAVAVAACGGVRKALVLLDQVGGIATEAGQLAAINETDQEVVAFQICRELMAKKVSWASVAAILRETKEDPEGLRWMVLSYFNTILVSKTSKNKARAALVLDCFQYNFFDTKRAGLSLACWRVYEACK